ncbi:MAG: hypothetical protein IH899_00660 [Planctomycetes bacterium]|nr:hypothetical protein [Planctomycetota bacterium]
MTGWILECANGSGEQELDRQEAEYEQLRRTWQQERLRLQQQLRARLAELRRAEPAVA